MRALGRWGRLTCWLHALKVSACACHPHLPVPSAAAESACGARFPPVA
ncbi:hypothetical protein SBD_5088 [Streptomyces bottropensis ATCC 25435]|uniref:Uncharacterized protein n=1 Tax=Streptomyces bottropensis ATCC 25435 TaxID=1054862 RepID=M3DB29_9ACTN|nr:hypothetical protein SBD_5088 [Streptomyces bottropensis ATCC 25435]